MARFNNIEGRKAGRGCGRGRHEYSGRGSNYRGLFNSRNRHNTSNRQNRGKDHFNRGRNVRSTSTSSHDQETVKCFNCQVSVDTLSPTCIFIF